MFIVQPGLILEAERREGKKKQLWVSVYKDTLLP